MTQLLFEKCSLQFRGCLEKAKIAHYCVAVMLAFVEYYLYTPRLCFSLLVLHQFYLFSRHPLIVY